MPPQPDTLDLVPDQNAVAAALQWLEGIAERDAWPPKLGFGLSLSLDEALAMRLEHYSVYGLIVEENTLFHTLHEKGKLPLPAEDEELAMYHRVMERMAGAGYDHYEVSNFARSGRESRHNTVYWRNESYYGVGAGAHGYVAGWRHENAKGVTEYIARVRKEGFPRVNGHLVSRTEAMEDMMMVGLRLRKGVTFHRFQERFGCPMQEVFGRVISELQQQGLLQTDEEGIRLTRRGLLYGNVVFASFLQSTQSVKRQ